MANLVYRKSTSPSANTITKFKGSPLTNDELDNNLFGIDVEVQTKAPINNATFTGTTIVSNTLGVAGVSTLAAVVATTGSFTTLAASSTLGVTGAATLSSTLGVSGATTLSSTLGVTGATILSSTLAAGASTLNSLTVTNAASAGSLSVTGASNLAAVTATTGAFTSLTSSTTLGVTTSATIGTTLGVNGGSLTTTATTFNLINATATTLNLGGAATTITVGAVTGTTTVRNNASITGTLGVTGTSALAAITATTGSFSGQVTSTVAIGTAPFVVTSTTKVTNLNADRVDDFTADQANTASNIVVRDASKNILFNNAVMSGATSGTATLQPTAAAGNVTITLPAITGTVALSTGNLSQFAATTSSQLAGVISDETGTGSLVFATSPTLATPTINTATISGGTINNTIIGGSTPAAGSFTSLSASTTLGVSGSLGVTGTTTLASVNATAGTFSGLIKSTLASPAAPIEVASNIKVTSLNADFVDGFDADQANTASNIVVRDASKNINISNAVMSGATSGTTTLQPTAISGASVLTLPAATDTLVGKATTDTLTNKTLTSPIINGGTFNVSAFAIRDTSAAFDVSIAATSSPALTAGRTLTLDMVNAARTIKLAGNIALAGNFTTSGAFGVTLTATALTSVTLPTTGILATLGGTETLTNKTLTSPTITGATINSTVIGGTATAAGSFTTLSASSTISSSAGISGSTLGSTVTTGTAPLTVASTTLVTNLNADSVDGIGFSAVNTSGVAEVDQRGGVAYASSASNITYVAPGTSGYILKSTGLNSAPVWVASTAIPAGDSLTAENIVGGSAGQLLYQGAAGSTNKLAIVAANAVLTSSGSAPQWSNSLTLSGTITHGGLTPSAGTNIDQIYTVTDSLTLNTTGWFDTSVNSTELTTGSYMVQVNTGNEYYTGIMSWYSPDISSVVTDEIILHRASAGSESSNLFLRVERTDNNASPDMTVQISSSAVRATANYTYKFRRMM